MPNYDFHCRNCGFRFSKSLPMSARKSAACEKCGSNDLEQLFKRCNLGGRSSGGDGGDYYPNVPAAGPSCSGSCGGCSGCS